MSRGSLSQSTTTMFLRDRLGHQSPVAGLSFLLTAVLVATLTAAAGCTGIQNPTHSSPVPYNTPLPGLHPSLLQPDGTPKPGIYPSDGSVRLQLQPALIDGTKIPHRLNISEAASLSLTELVVIRQLKTSQERQNTPESGGSKDPYVTRATVRDPQTIAELVDALDRPVEVSLAPA